MAGCYVRASCELRLVSGLVARTARAPAPSGVTIAWVVEVI